MYYLYILTHISFIKKTGSKYVKIGSTCNPNNRLHTYNTSSATAYKYISIYKLKNYCAYQLDDDIKTNFHYLNYRDPINPGSIEMYDISIISKLENYFKRKSIKFELFKEPFDLSKFGTVNKNDSIKDIQATLKFEYKIENKLQNKLTIIENEPVIKIVPHDYQKKVIDSAIKHFKKSNNGKINLFCRLGKTYISYWIAEALKCNKILILVPSIGLLFQTYFSLKEISLEYKYLLICSRSNRDVKDEITCKIENIKKFMNINSKYIIISTYQSALTKLNSINDKLDICIFDEAHKTTGIASKSTGFKCLLKDSKLKIDKRLFLTATEKFYVGKNSKNYTVFSMDNKKIYGDTIYSINCNEAINLNAINRYKIITMKGKNINTSTLESEYHAKAEAIICSMLEKSIKHVITFHNKIKNAKLFMDKLQLIIDKNKHSIKVMTIHGSMSIKQRTKILNDFKNENDVTIITSAKVLQEGINIPICDGVAFIDKKTSTIECVQSLSRCLTKRENKGCSYIMIPIITNEKNIVNHRDFQILRIILRNLSEYDNNIKGYFTNVLHGYNRKMENIVEMKTVYDNYEQMCYNIAPRVWEDLDKFSLLPFETARDIVRGLNIESINMWYDMLITKEIPQNIPYKPDVIYKNFGWKDWDNWLGLSKNLDIEELYVELLFDNHEMNNLLNEYSNHKIKEICKKLNINLKLKKVDRIKSIIQTLDEQRLVKNKRAQNGIKRELRKVLSKMGEYKNIDTTYLGYRLYLLFNINELRTICSSNSINSYGDKNSLIKGIMNLFHMNNLMIFIKEISIMGHWYNSKRGLRVVNKDKILQYFESICENIPTGRRNINKISKNILKKKIEYLTEPIAKKIVKKRPFKNYAEIRKIDGVGKNTYNQIKHMFFIKSGKRDYLLDKLDMLNKKHLQLVYTAFHPWKLKSDFCGLKKDQLLVSIINSFLS